MRKKVEISAEEREIDEVYEALRSDAIQAVLNAFNEGYLLGHKHATRRAKNATRRAKK